MSKAKNSLLQCRRTQYSLVPLTWWGWQKMRRKKNEIGRGKITRKYQRRVKGEKTWIALLRKLSVTSLLCALREKGSIYFSQCFRLQSRHLLIFTVQQYPRAIPVNYPHINLTNASRTYATTDAFEDPQNEDEQALVIHVVEVARARTNKYRTFYVAATWAMRIIEMLLGSLLRGGGKK